MNKHHLQRSAARLAMLLLVPLSAASLAFEPDVHRHITERGLGAASHVINMPVGIEPSQRTLLFSGETIDVIANQNANVDYATLFGVRYDSGPNHFDGNSLYDSTDRLSTSRLTVMDKIKRFSASDWNAYVTELAGLRRSDMDGAVKSVHVELGYILHAIQDFYSHSTWIDLGRRGPGDFPWGDSKFRLLGDPSNGSACIDGTNLARGADLVTEFFALTDLGRQADANSGRCIHGPASKKTCAEVSGLLSQFCTIGLDVTSNGERTNGINKDSPARVYYSEAFDAAQDATTKFANTLLADIAAHSPDAACVVAAFDKWRDCDLSAKVFALATGGTSTLNPYTTNVGLLTTPIYITIRSSQYPSVGDSKQQQITPIYANVEQVKSAPTLNGFSPRVCNVAGKWRPMSYQWRSAYCAGNSGQDFFGTVTVGDLGDLTVVYDSRAYRNQTCPSFSGSSTTDIHRVHKQDLYTGSGSSEYSLRNVTPNGQVTTNSYITRAEWDAEAQLPPALPGLFMRLVQRVPLNQPLPAECESN